MGNYPLECEKCETMMELKGSWISKTGMIIKLHQCPECKTVEIELSERGMEELST